MPQDKPFDTGIVGWDGDDDDSIGGYLNLNVDFLRELVDRWDDEDPDLNVNERDETMITLNFKLRPAERGNVHWLGSAWHREPEKKKSSRRGRDDGRGKKKQSRRR